jgi:DNA-binding NtrC family response regulator
VRLVDPLASRQHARLYVDRDLVEIEDLGSANGTRLREAELASGTRAMLHPGEAVTIGSTVLLLQSRAPSFTARQVWPHAYFESRLIEECGRAETLRGSFAVLRVRLDSDALAARARDPIARALRPGDVLATYGPREYEALLADSDRAQSEALAAAVGQALREQQIAAATSLALYPEDATSPQALITHASALLFASANQGGEPGKPVAGGFIVRNAKMGELYALADRAAAGSINVLITGETGAGKEVLAETIHKRSPRAGKPFIAFNCAALSESLVASELFGHEKGAFTGAVQTRAGLIEAASGGTLFLDEVGEMSLAMQATLLRVLETRQVLRVGATKPVSVDVRLIAATNRDLEEEVAQKTFRADLYFRLGGLSLEIPPLRERVDEIEPLARLWVENAARQLGRGVPEVTPDALDLLRAYEWPGNIRQLRNVMERALLLCTGDAITPLHLPLQKTKRAIGEAAAHDDDTGPAAAAPAEAESALSLREKKDALERQAIIDALGRCAGSQTRAAELLGISRRTLCSRIKQYNIPRPHA